ncbi:MAG: hypothetical protein U0269_18245 [Polyangiales bacterium]
MRTLSSSFAVLASLASFTVAAQASASRIASRGSMTCAINESRAVLCWGSFSSDSRTPPSAPTERARDATAVIVGLSRACALHSDATVSCWSGSSPAQRVAGLASVQELAGGAGPLCARTSDGAVRCADATQPALNFTLVPGITGAQQIVAGQSHACARLRDGAVRCWGDGTQNQLGEGQYQRRASPVVARLLGRATDLAAGDDFTCARASDGRVLCAGYRFDATGSPRLRTAWTPGVLPRAERLFAGAAMVCGLQRGGGVQCAGFDDVIAMGPGDYALSFASGTLASSSDAEEVAIGSRSLCVRGASGVVKCIGDDARLALGGASGPAVRGPVRVAGVDGATRLVAAGNHSCAIVANGQVKCWGFDDPQDLFATSGERSGVIGRRPTATLLASITGATEVLTNGATTVVRLSDGSLAMWGAGPFEPMGRVEGDGRDRLVRIAAAPQRVQYALGIQHLCAVRRDGAIECAGSGQYGQWGAGTALPSMNGDSWFRREFSAVNALGSASALASGWHTLCAVGRDASLRCWGQNASLLLSSQSAGGAVASAVRRDESALPREVEQVALGGVHSRVLACVRRRGGVVGCWGANDQWQTGASGPRERTEENRVEIAPAVHIATGASHACAATNAGAVWCWGANDRGQCGAGPSGSPREITGVRDAVEVAAGRWHSCARTRDGAVWCWGSTLDGALGDGSSSYVAALTQVPFPR